jgi:di/tricarboxylate transporter
MTTSPGWDQLPPPEPVVAPVPHDQTGEPLGYNLEAAAMYEQPPAPPEPFRQATPAQAGKAQVVAGFALALVGLLVSPLAFFATVISCAIGTVISGAALDQSRRAGSPYPRLAVAGLVLGVIGLIIGVVLFAVAAVTETLP